MVQKMRQIETRLSSPAPLLEGLRKELEGLSNAKVVVAHRASARARIRGIRNSHVARCSAVFFKKNRFGFLEFNPMAGRILMRKLFGPY